MVAKNARNLGLEVIQRVAMLGEDDQLALPTGAVPHLRGILQDLREFVPFPVLARGDNGPGLLFQPLQELDLTFQFMDRSCSRGIIDQGFFEVLLLVGCQVVIVVG